MQPLFFSSSSWHSLVHFFLPITCAVCRRDLPAEDEGRICGGCEEVLAEMPELFCKLCGAHLPDGGAHCFHCRKGEAPKHLEKIRAGFLYNDTLKNLVHQFKYEGKEWLAKPLARLLWRKASSEILAMVSLTEVIIPVPMFPRKQRQRGYNQAQRLAQEWGSLGNRPVFSYALTKIKNTPPQMGLSRERRRENVEDSFVLGPDGAHAFGKRVLLVDDVCTTASTLDTCAKVLMVEGKAQSVCGLILARD